MDNNVLLSKIVATPTESTWSQAYSTLNLYIVMSMKSDTDKSMAAAGKELFEKIQREYFSLDEKNLKNIKEAVEKGIVDVEDKDSISVVLGTITGNILYVVIASAGSAILKRSGKVGEVAKGETGIVAAFSGELKSDDVVILESGDFASKISVDKLQSVLDDLSVTEISENLTPLIHETPIGTEAAIVLQYKNLSAPAAIGIVDEETPEEVKEEIKNDDKTMPEEEIVEAPELAVAKPPKKPFKFPKVFSLSNKKIIFVAIILLVVILAGSIYMEKQRQEGAKRQAALEQILAPEQKKYDEASALLALNKGLALDEFNTIKTDLDGKESQFPQGTAERKKFDEFVGKVEGQIGQLGSGSTLAGETVLYDKGADFVALVGSTLAAVKRDTGSLITMGTDGASQKTYETKNKNVTAVGSDDTSIYVAGDLGITKTNIKTGATTTGVKDTTNIVSLATFGPNLYSLNTKTKTVDKYVGGAGAASTYFKGSITLNDPVSMTIDGSVWIIDNGKIRKFTKGTEDTFTVSGTTKDISNSASISTNVDFANVYVLDPNATRIISISKSDGSVKNQYVSKDLSSSGSFVVDESSKKIFVIIGSKLYSFDL